MKNFIVVLFVSFGSTAFAQQQNLWVQNNINPPAQQFSGNFSNIANTDNNVGNEIQQQSFKNENNPIQIQQAFGNLSNTNKSFSIDLSLNTKSFSSSSSSSSKTNRRAFSKKISKFKRNFYGKLMAHKKSRHQVDICFNWK